MHMFLQGTLCSSNYALFISTCPCYKAFRLNDIDRLNENQDKRNTDHQGLLHTKKKKKLVKEFLQESHG